MKRARIILIVLFFGVLCFVFGNSLLSPEISAAFSDSVGELLANIFGKEGGVDSVGGFPLRKVAHFVEFAALGAISTLLLLTFSFPKDVKGCLLALFGLLIPVVDETLQIFSSRGSSLRDVWIDCGGFVFGCAVVYLALLLIDFCKKKRKKQL